MDGDYGIIVGGPPCKPRSCVNLVRRGSKHRDYGLVSSFFEHIERMKPKAFLFANVPPIDNDEALLSWLRKMKTSGYSIVTMKVRYSDYGAKTKRGRLIAFGSLGGKAKLFEEKLAQHKCEPETVRDKIWLLRDKEIGEVPDHVWPQLNTLSRYKDRYDSGQYGWYVLDWNKPAPSFGNVMKTYILHPESFNGGTTCVISVREAYRIMGFNTRFRFPNGNSMGARYQMTVDSVGPVFSKKAVKVIKQILIEECKTDCFAKEEIC